MELHKLGYKNTSRFNLDWNAMPFQVLYLTTYNFVDVKCFFLFVILIVLISDYDHVIMNYIQTYW